MFQTQSIKLTSLILLLCIFSLSACSKKIDSSENNSAAQSTNSTQKADKKPELGQNYQALYAKAKENVANALARNPKNFINGTHYTTLAGQQGLVGSGEKIEIVEFFSYGCPACFGAESSMHAYAELLPEDVEFIRVPVSFNPQYEILARGYYSAKALGASEEAHIALFDAIHIKRQNMYSTAALANFYSAYGIDKATFKKTVKSFSVNALIQRDKNLAQSFQVSGVPSVVVNGKYLTGGRKAGTMDAWMQILDFLADKERVQKKWTTK